MKARIILIATLVAILTACGSQPAARIPSIPIPGHIEPSVIEWPEYMGQLPPAAMLGEGLTGADAKKNLNSPISNPVYGDGTYGLSLVFTEGVVSFEYTYFDGTIVQVFRGDLPVNKPMVYKIGDNAPSKPFSIIVTYGTMDLNSNTNPNEDIPLTWKTSPWP